LRAVCNASRLLLGLLSQTYFMTFALTALAVMARFYRFLRALLVDGYAAHRAAEGGDRQWCTPDLSHGLAGGREEEWLLAHLLPHGAKQWPPVAAAAKKQNKAAASQQTPVAERALRPASSSDEEQEELVGEDHES
jgi:hypothetical protein